jgi:hypothetical protein
VLRIPALERVARLGNPARVVEVHLAHHAASAAVRMPWRSAISWMNSQPSSQSASPFALQ